MLSEKELYHDISAKLETYRTDLKISKRQLSIKTGITPVYIREVLRGDRKPSVYILMVLCNAMGINLSELFENLEEKNT